MEKIYEQCAGIDIQKKQVTVCVMSGETKTSRIFSTGESGIQDMVRWLEECRCEAAVLDNRDPLWENLYHTLDQALDETALFVIHREELKERYQDLVRNTRDTDAEWMAYLLSYGLIQAVDLPGAVARNDCKQLRRTRRDMEESLARQLESMADIVEKEKRRLGMDIGALPVHEDLAGEVKELLRSHALPPVRKELLEVGWETVTDLQQGIARMGDLIQAYERKK